MTRSVESLIGRYNEQIKIIKADVSNYAELLKAMAGIDVAFYLIHSMEGSSKEWNFFYAMAVCWHIAQPHTNQSLSD